MKVISRLSGRFLVEITPEELTSITKEEDFQVGQHLEIKLDAPTSKSKAVIKSEEPKVENQATTPAAGENKPKRTVFSSKANEK